MGLLNEISEGTSLCRLARRVAKRKRPCARTREALAGRSRPPPVIEHQHLLASTLPLAHQRCAGLQLRADPEPFGLLQPQPDLTEVAVHLNAQPTRGDFLGPTVDRTHQQLTAEARPSSRSRLSRAPAKLRAILHTVCRLAPESVRRGDRAVLRCRHGLDDRWGKPCKALVGSCR